MFGPFIPIPAYGFFGACPCFAFDLATLNTISNADMLTAIPMITENTDDFCDAEADIPLMGKNDIADNSRMTMTVAIVDFAFIICMIISRYERIIFLMRLAPARVVELLVGILLGLRRVELLRRDFLYPVCQFLF
jgi:hypothetical protein